MKDNLNNDVVVNADAFAIATQMYVRMRRVSGRVIDVIRTYALLFIDSLW
nr:hypothetical protein [Acinetobacter haemolyticus]